MSKITIRWRMPPQNQPGSDGASTKRALHRTDEPHATTPHTMRKRLPSNNFPDFEGRNASVRLELREFFLIISRNRAFVLAEGASHGEHRGDRLTCVRLRVRSETSQRAVIVYHLPAHNDRGAYENTRNRSGFTLRACTFSKDTTNINNTAVCILYTGGL